MSLSLFFPPKTCEKALCSPQGLFWEELVVLIVGRIALGAAGCRLGCGGCLGTGRGWVQDPDMENFKQVTSYKKEEVKCDHLKLLRQHKKYFIWTYLKEGDTKNKATQKATFQQNWVSSEPIIHLREKLSDETRPIPGVPWRGWEVRRRLQLLQQSTRAAAAPGCPALHPLHRPLIHSRHLALLWIIHKTV